MPQDFDDLQRYGKALGEIFDTIATQLSINPSDVRSGFLQEIKTTACDADAISKMGVIYKKHHKDVFKAMAGFTADRLVRIENGEENLGDMVRDGKPGDFLRSNPINVFFPEIYPVLPEKTVSLSTTVNAIIAVNLFRLSLDRFMTPEEKMAYQKISGGSDERMRKPFITQLCGIHPELEQVRQKLLALQGLWAAAVRSAPGARKEPSHSAPAEQPDWTPEERDIWMSTQTEARHALRNHPPAGAIRKPEISPKSVPIILGGQAGRIVKAFAYDHKGDPAAVIQPADVVSAVTAADAAAGDKCPLIAQGMLAASLYAVQGKMVSAHWASDLANNPRIDSLQKTFVGFVRKSPDPGRLLTTFAEISHPDVFVLANGVAGKLREAFNLLEHLVNTSDTQEKAWHSAQLDQLREECLQSLAINYRQCGNGAVRV